MLEKMQEETKAEGKKDRNLYAKFKCYCDTNTEKTNKSIDEGTAKIAKLSAQISELLGSTGKLSMEVAKLTADIADLEQAMDDAEHLRDEQHDEFLATESDLNAALDQMAQAIQTLSDVGADLTSETRDKADHAKFTKGKREGDFLEKRSLTKLAIGVENALKAATSLLSTAQQKKVVFSEQVTSFLEKGPVYAAQSGQVTGILKNMRDTFEENLENAIATEDAQAKAHQKFMDTSNDALDKMNESLENKNVQLGDNDSALADARGEKKTAEKLLAEDNDFLETLTADCKLKTDEYEERKGVRAQEEAAISEAISVLSSDDAFDTFTTAGRTNAFIQINSMAPEKQIANGLSAAAKKTKSLKLAMLAAKVKAGNPFEVLFEEIDKLIAAIEDEEKADDEKFAWCEEEQTTNREKKSNLESDITSLEADIADLKQLISDHENTIAETNDNLEDNATAQKDATQQRAETKANYDADIANKNASLELLAKATAILQSFYEENETFNKIKTFAQVDQRPEAPETLDYKDKGGNKVIELLQTIQDETNDEIKTANKEEEESIADYESLMSDLKKTQADLEKTLAETKMALSEATEKKENKENTLADKNSELEATKAYLAKIKPGCDFIQKNIDKRKTNRKTETDALNNATKQLKSTPAYKKIVNEAEQRALGECKDTCNAMGKDHAECQACLYEVSVPAYCTSNPDTPGC